jgi:tetratricopeptide (TPR) repeat protein
MGRIEKTVFISYRRTNFPWAYCIYQDLTHHGFDVFFDYQSIDSGNFERVILDNIRARAHFIVILAPSALERCNEPGDWFRREIETAMDERRNIIPIMLESFDFGSPLVKKSLTGKLAILSGYNGMSLIAEYMEAGLDKLRYRYLDVSLDDIHFYPLTQEAKEITETQKAAANEAPPVERTELTGQEWFERGYIFDKSENYDEAIRCFTEAIHLKADFAIALTFRGLARQKKGDLEGAINDFDEAIDHSSEVLGLNPENAEAYNQRGAARLFKGDVDGAIQDYSEVIRLRPVSASNFINRGNARQKKGDVEGAFSDFTEAIRLDPDAKVYVNRGVIFQNRGDIDSAISDFTEAISLDPKSVEAYLNRGIALKTKNDLDNAIIDYDNAIHLNPKYAEAYHARARARQEKGDLDNAISDYTEIIHIKPDYVNAYWGRGNIFWAKEDYSSAATDYQKYFDLGGNNEGLRYYLEESKRRSKTDNGTY